MLHGHRKLYHSYTYEDIANDVEKNLIHQIMQLKDHYQEIIKKSLD